MEWSMNDNIRLKSEINKTEARISQWNKSEIKIIKTIKTNWWKKNVFQCEQTGRKET